MFELCGLQELLRSNKKVLLSRAEQMRSTSESLYQVKTALLISCLLRSISEYMSSDSPEFDPAPDFCSHRVKLDHARERVERLLLQQD